MGCSWSADVAAGSYLEFLELLTPGLAVWAEPVPGASGTWHQLSLGYPKEKMSFDSSVRLAAQLAGIGQWLVTNWLKVGQDKPNPFRGSQRNAGGNKLYHTRIIPEQRLMHKKPGIPAWHLVPASCNLLPGSLHPSTSSITAPGGAQGEGGEPIMVLTGELLAN